MLTFAFSTSCTRLVRLRIEASARSIDVLRATLRQYHWMYHTHELPTYQVRIVSIKLNDAFEAWSRAMSFERAVSLETHFIRSINRMCSPVFSDSRVCSSSEKIETQSVKTMMTCSIMIRDLRDLAASSFPIRKPCN